MSTPAFVGTVETTTREYTAATVRYDGYPEEVGTNLAIIANRDGIAATAAALLATPDWYGICHDAPNPETHTLPEVDTHDRKAVYNAYSNTEYVYKDFIRARSTTVDSRSTTLVPGIGDYYKGSTPVHVGRLLGRTGIEHPSLTATGGHTSAHKEEWVPDWAYLFVTTDGEYTGQLLVLHRDYLGNDSRFRAVSVVDLQSIAGDEVEAMFTVRSNA